MRNKKVIIFFFNEIKTIKGVKFRPSSNDVTLEHEVAKVRPSSFGVIHVSP